MRGKVVAKVKKQVQPMNRGDVTYVVFHLGAEIAIAVANALEGLATFGAIASRHIDTQKNKKIQAKEFSDSVLEGLERMDVQGE